MIAALGALVRGYYDAGGDLHELRIETCSELARGQSGRRELVVRVQGYHR